MKAVGNKMIHVGIIQRILKKLVQLRQKIDIPQLKTNKPFLFVPTIFKHPSDSLISWLIPASPTVRSSNFDKE